MSFLNNSATIIRTENLKEKENSRIWRKFEKDLKDVHSRLFEKTYNVSIPFKPRRKFWLFFIYLKTCFDTILKTRTKYIVIYGCLVRNLILCLMLYVISFSRQKIILLEFAFSTNERHSKRLLVNIVSKTLNIIGVCSKYEVARYSKDFSSNKFRYIPAPIENDCFTYKTIGEQEQGLTYILSAGRGCRDYKTLIEAALILDKFNFVIISDRESFDKIETIPKNVKLFFNVERDIYFEILKQSSAVVVPIKELGKSAGHQVIYQAMAMSKPVIATKTNTTSEIIKNYYNGVFFPEGDSQALSREINNLILNKELLVTISENASKSSENYSIKTYFDFLKKALDESPH